MSGLYDARVTKATDGVTVGMLSCALNFNFKKSVAHLTSKQENQTAVWFPCVSDAIYCTVLQIPYMCFRSCFINPGVK